MKPITELLGGPIHLRGTLVDSKPQFRVPLQQKRAQIIFECFLPDLTRLIPKERILQILKCLNKN